MGRREGGTPGGLPGTLRRVAPTGRGVRVAADVAVADLGIALAPAEAAVAVVGAAAAAAAGAGLMLALLPLVGSVVPVAAAAFERVTRTPPLDEPVPAPEPLAAAGTTAAAFSFSFAACSFSFAARSFAALVAARAAAVTLFGFPTAVAAANAFDLPAATGAEGFGAGDTLAVARARNVRSSGSSAGSMSLSSSSSSSPCSGSAASSAVRFAVCGVLRGCGGPAASFVLAATCRLGVTGGI